MSLTIRARLTAWYTAVLLAVLILFGGWVYVMESRLRLEDVDAGLRRAGAPVAAALAAEFSEGASLAEAAPEAVQDFAAPGRLLAIHDANGVPVADGGAALRVAPLPAPGEATVSLGNEDWRISVQGHGEGAGRHYVVLGESLARARAQAAILRRTLLVGIPLALALAAAGGWWIARRALQPVSLMVGQAGQITHQTPGFRLRVPHPGDELGRLAQAFNALLGRLEGALSAQRQFMADASHELRTPVSIARTAADVTLGHATRTEQEYRDSLTVVVRQTQRLSRMVDDMLTLARADAGGLGLAPADFYLDEMVAECVYEAGLLAGGRGVEVRSTGPPDTPFRGDERLLRQALMNLLDNAIRHTPPGGRVEVRLTVAPPHLEIAVADTGGGVPPEDRERIFERFVRTDPARSGPGGAGLGLPIARCLAEAHGGTVSLQESGPSGSTFLIRLPLRPGGPGAPNPAAAGKGTVIERSSALA